MGDWSRLEVEAVVADYFVMFAKELRQEPYSKTAHRRALQKLLDNRSEGSIEFKHQNISAVLLELDYPYVPGYKPRSNYQQLLADVVTERLIASREIEADVDRLSVAPVSEHFIDDPLGILVPPPDRSRPTYTREQEATGTPRLKSRVNYLEREARNSLLGLAGEKLVLNFEQARLTRAGLHALAARIEHTSVVDGDGAGFDVRSFDDDGSERLIEVKTTAWGKQTPFFVTKNELAVSRANDQTYHLYRLFEFRKNPRLFTVQGALSDSFDLDPVNYVARIA